MTDLGFLKLVEVPRLEKRIHELEAENVRIRAIADDEIRVATDRAEKAEAELHLYRENGFVTWEVVHELETACEVYLRAKAEEHHRAEKAEAERCPEPSHHATVARQFEELRRLRTEVERLRADIHAVLKAGSEWFPFTRLQEVYRELERKYGGGRESRADHSAAVQAQPVAPLAANPARPPRPEWAVKWCEVDGWSDAQCSCPDFPYHAARKEAEA